jgi:probable addiction module antidote protein
MDESDIPAEPTPAELQRIRAKTRPWDAADHLKTNEAIAAYLNEVLAENDAQAFAAALGTVARAKGMTNLAREIGASRESLYKSLSPNGSPGLDTIFKVVDALGIHLAVQPGSATA